MISDCWKTSVLFLFLICSQVISKTDSGFPIRIALAVDQGSLRDMILLSRSIVESAHDIDQVFIHVVACGENDEKALELSKIISFSLRNCTPELKFDITPFHIPRNSGFYNQLIRVKQKAHWSSSVGADMVRFFIPKLFSKYDRILYLDNDILITCCLEEIWGVTFELHQVAGVILDDLKWASKTQFQRHYNASHPLVQSNFRRIYSSSSSSISTTARKSSPSKPLESSRVTLNEWLAAVPKYPNDGVILFDIQKYNQLNLLQAADDIAAANSRGEYVVGIGSQQFTVLLLHDRWHELSPRANLRHFPDMARGFMMWFNYHGFLHYSGSNKPLQICHQGHTSNIHRKHSYTPWATVAYHLLQNCPRNEHLQALQYCVQKQIFVRSFRDLSEVIRSLARVYDGEGNVVIKIETTSIDRKAVIQRRDSKLIDPDTPSKDAMIPSYKEIEKFNDVISHSGWSQYVYSPIVDSHSNIEKQNFSTTLFTLIKPKSASKQAIRLFEFVWSSWKLNQPSSTKSIYSSKRTSKNMIEMLNGNGLRHLDVVGMTLELNLDIFTKEFSLNLISSLDLGLMRPKFIFISIFSSYNGDDKNEISGGNRCIDERFIDQISKFLRRSGFLLSELPANDDVVSEGISGYKYAPSRHQRSCRSSVCICGARINHIEIAFNK